MPDIDNDFKDIEKDFSVTLALLQEGYLAEALTSPNSQTMSIQLNRNVQGEVSSADIDHDKDGKTDRKLSFTREPRTREVTRVDIDTNVDGKTDALMIFRRSQFNGQLSSVSIDRNMDGSADQSLLFHRSKQNGLSGQILSINLDRLNGTDERLNFHRIGPGLEGVLNSLTLDSNGDNKADANLKFNYFGANLYSIDIDRNVDGTFDSHLRINRNRVQDFLLIDRNGDGAYESKMHKINRNNQTRLEFE